MQVLLFVSLCLHLGMAKKQTSSFLINSSLQYKSAHLWPSANQLYRRASAECVMTWLPSLMLWFKSQSTVLFQALLRNYIIKNSKFWTTVTWKTYFYLRQWIEFKETFLYCFFTVSFSICRWNPGTDELHQREKQKSLWAGSYAYLTLHSSLKMTSGSLVTTYSFAQNRCICASIVTAEGTVDL